MAHSNGSGFFHHFIPKPFPCILIPSMSPPEDSDHILNLSASLTKHLPPTTSSKSESNDALVTSSDKTQEVSKISAKHSYDRSPSPDLDSNESVSKVDMNCNNLTKASVDDRGESGSVESENGHLEDEQMTEIEVDCGEDCSDDSESPRDLKSEKKSKSLAFGIDRILSSDDARAKKPPTSPPLTRHPSPPVVSNLFTTEGSRHKKHHSSLLSKLRLCTDKKRTPSVPFFHSYTPYPHHHHSPLNSILSTTSPPTSTSTPSSGAHSTHHHHHPLSQCSDCLYLRRYCGASSGPRIPTSSANNVSANNMQFSTPMATPCGPSVSSISASFAWMANPSIYDSSAIISPVSGYNPHVPLQPSFGLGTSGYSTLATIQHCNATGGSGRRKRSWSRAVFSNLQRKGLEKRFQLQKYITKPDRRQLAATLGLTDAQVKVWFQNRRMKWRHSKEGKVSSGTGETTVATPSSSPVTSTTSSKVDGAIKDKKP